VVIAARRVHWEEEKNEWALEKEAAKATKKPFGKKKPTLGVLPAVIPKPTIAAADEESSDEAGSDTNND
jgi:hypothetical protein